MITLERISPGMRTVLPGLALALLTILFGQAMGIVFGVNEDLFHDSFKASAMEVRDTIYKGDDAAIEVVLDRAWRYMLRAHLHAGGMGTTAFALIVLLGLVCPPRKVAAAASVALGAGGFGYALYWMLAGFRAPGMGGTGPAKESLSWLAMPSSGMFVLATVIVFVAVLGSVFGNRSAGSSGE
jgi:hypothetical protein